MADVATAWISGAFALAGAFGTFVATSTRQRNIRWDERKFLIYSDFLDQLNAAAKAMSDEALAEAGEEPVPGRDLAFHKRARSYAWDKLHPLRRQVELVASKEVESKAGDAFDALLTLDELRSGGKSPDDAHWDEVYQGFNHARSGLIRAVRHELAIVITDHGRGYPDAHPSRLVERGRGPADPGLPRPEARRSLWHRLLEELAHDADCRRSGGRDGPWRPQARIRAPGRPRQRRYVLRC